MSLTEYKPGTTFTGRMGRTVSESEPAWPAPLRSEPGAPNVLYIVLDDTGYGQFGCYGSPIDTPNLDRLAQNGLRYTNMHTTALCSPSRSCMLTGRNHHSNGMACITEGSTGYPGSNGAIPFENGFLSEMLLPHGYATFCVGKWHLTPAEQISAAGPYDRWPLGRGFDRYYGFLGGDTHQYYPDLVFDNHQVEPPKTPEEGYHLSRRPGRQGHRVHRRPQAGGPGQALLPVLRHGRQPRAPPGAQGMGRQVQGPVRRRLGRLPREGVRAAEGTGHRRRGRRAVAPRPRRAAVGRAVGRRAQALRPDDGGLRRILRAHRPPDRTACSTSSRRPWPAGQHASSWSSPTTGPAPRAARTVRSTRTSSSTTCPTTSQQNLAALDDLGGPKYFNHYPWGWTFAGNTPVPAVEARDLPRRRLRPVHRALAQGHQGQGRDPQPVRARDRHGAHRARVTGHRRTDRAPRRRPVPDRGRQLRAHLRRRRPRRPSTTRSTSRCSPTARSITTAGARCARSPARRSPRRA